jgi:hypothetical protein
MFSSNHVWSSYLMVMSWCHVQGCTGHGGSGIQGSSKRIAETNHGWPNSRWGLPSTEWIYLFIFKTLSLPWGWLPTGRRLRGRTRPGYALYYGSLPTLQLLCPDHVMPNRHLVVMSYHHVKWRCPFMLSCHVMSYGYVMSLCHGMLL